MRPTDWRTTSLSASSIDYHGHRSITHFFRTAPRVKALGGVGANDQKELVAGADRSEAREGVGHEGRTAAPNLKVGDLNSIQALSGSFGHDEPVGGGCDRTVCGLLPGITGNHQQHPIECQRMPDFQGDRKVAHMWRIEGAPYYTDSLTQSLSHGGECMRRRHPNGADTANYRLAGGFRPRSDTCHAFGSLPIGHDVRMMVRSDRRMARNGCAHGTDSPPSETKAGQALTCALGKECHE